MKLTNSVETKQTLDMHQIADLNEKEAIKFFNSSSRGLTRVEVLKRQERYGKNKLPENSKNKRLHFLKEAFVTPFTAILIILAIVSFGTNYLFVANQDKDLSTVIIMLVMIIISGTISFCQSIKTDDSVQNLLSMISNSVTIKREGIKGKVPVESLVPGDIVILSAGDVVAADIRLLTSNDLFCSTASLNGESQPVKKHAQIRSNTVESMLDLDNIVYEGSAILSGYATGIVVATGGNTFFGDLARRVGDEKEKNTAFDVGIRQISKMLLAITLIIAPIVFLINGLTKGDWLNALIFAIATAVGLTPEMLPVIVTSNLVKGSVELSKKGTIVKQVNAMQNLGSIDILCTDKTGTLTEEKVKLKDYVGLNGKKDELLLQAAYLNSHLQSGNLNLIDQAIDEAASKRLPIQKIETNFIKIGEIPFDFKRRKLSIAVQSKDGHTYLITKGAAEEMLNSVQKLKFKGQEIPLTDDWKNKIKQKITSFNQLGYRVILLAYKELTAGEKITQKTESDLTMLGMLTFMDPPKDSVTATLKQLKQSGVQVKILTGDNAAVTLNIARQVGLDDSKVYSESDFKDKSEVQMRQMVEESSLFVKLSPQMKAKIIALLKKNDHCVAYMGDGINDAPAMRAADVAISVESGTDIAKQCADVILLKKDLRILNQGIKIGRKVFGNTMKYLKITLSSNFGNILSILVASSFLPFLPMKPLQLLVLDLMYGTSCLAIPFDEMNQDYLKIPKKWELEKLPKFMFILGPTSSIFDVVTYGVLYFWLCPWMIGTSYALATPVQKTLFATIFCTGWFIESLWTQEMVIQVLRAPGMPLINQHASKLVMLATIGIAVIGTILPYTIIGKALDFAIIPKRFLLIVLIILSLYVLLTSVVKKIYLKTETDLI